VSPRARRRWLALLTILAIAGTLNGCGRYGRPIRPVSEDATLASDAASATAEESEEERENRSEAESEGAPPSVPPWEQDRRPAPDQF
jgi:hypothetical protein